MRFFRDMRLAGGLAAAALVLSGCGDLTATQGAVPNSADMPHLSQEEFVPAMVKAMKAAGSVHIESSAAKGNQKSTFVGDASMVPGGSLQIKLRDQLGLYGKATTKTFELRLIGNRMFISAPGRRGKFYMADASDPRTLCGCIAKLLREEASPAGMVDNFRKSLVGLEFLGLEARDGLYLQHYRAKLDPKRLLGPQRAKQLKAPEVFIYELWLDSDNLVRTVSGKLLAWDHRATYTDWGKRIDLDEPLPRQILNAPRA